MKNRPVDVYQYEKNPESMVMELNKVGSGRFLEFGLDVHEQDFSAASFSTALVEMPDGTVKNIDVDLIRFTDVQDDREQAKPEEEPAAITPNGTKFYWGDGVTVLGSYGVISKKDSGAEAVIVFEDQTKMLLSVALELDPFIHKRGA